MVSSLSPPGSSPIPCCGPAAVASDLTDACHLFHGLTAALWHMEATSVSEQVNQQLGKVFSSQKKEARREEIILQSQRHERIFGSLESYR